LITSGGIFDDNNIEDKIKILEKKVLEKDFWKNQKNAQKISKEKKFFEDIYNNYNKSSNDIKN